MLWGITFVEHIALHDAQSLGCCLHSSLWIEELLNQGNAGSAMKLTEAVLSHNSSSSMLIYIAHAHV